MKKIITILGAFFFASVVLTSYGGKLTACDCAEISIKMLEDALSAEYTEDEFEEAMVSKYKLEKCYKLMKDETFANKSEECYNKKMKEMDN